MLGSPLTGLSQLLGRGLAPHREATLILNEQGESASVESAKSLWDKFKAYRKAGFVKPFHVRRTPRACKAYALGGYIVKEYTGSRQKVEAEIRILQQLFHERLVSYEFIADEGARISIFMAWAGVPLRDHRLTRADAYDEDAARHTAHQLAAALAYLHARGIVHRDIKPDNLGVLLDQRLQLFDWGEAVSLEEASVLTDKELGRAVGVAGTPLFMPPESLNHLTRRPGGECGCGGGCARSGADGRGVPSLRATLAPALDVWGLGTVVYFVIAGRDVFVGDSAWELEELADVVNRSGGVPLPEGAPASFAARDFLARCLERCPARRASAAELLGHPWLRGAATQAEVAAARAADERRARAGGRCGSVSSLGSGRRRGVWAVRASSASGSGSGAGASTGGGGGGGFSTSASGDGSSSAISDVRSTGSSASSALAAARLAQARGGTNGLLGPLPPSKAAVATCGLRSSATGGPQRASAADAGAGLPGSF